jgi:hypothetical protein
MNRSLLPAVPILLGALLWPSGASIQLRADPIALETKPFSVAELERFLGGRTLVTVDLKNATLSQVGAALSESTRLKIAPRAIRHTGQSATTLPPGATRPPEITPPPEPTFTLAANKQPFWEALRDWSLASRHAAGEAKKAALPQNGPRIPLETMPTSVQVQRGMGDWELSPGDNLAEGRAVSAWPFLIIGSDLRRVQDGRLTDAGLEELASPPATALAQAVSTKPVPDEKHWQDRLLLTALVLPDPKFNPTNLSFDVEEAIDEKGNDLRAPRGEKKRFSGTYSISLSGSPHFVVLASRPDMGKRLVKLRGTLSCDVVTRTHHWETKDPMKPVKDILYGKGGDYKIRYTGMVPNGTTWKTTLEVQSRGSHLENYWKRRVENGPGALAGSSSYLGGIFEYTGPPMDLRLSDAQERNFMARPGSHFNRVERSATGIEATANQATNTAASSPADFSTTPPDIAQNWNYFETYTFEFYPPYANPGTPAAGKPANLSFDLPIERRQVSVPFEFTDLPLPPSLWTPRP